MKILQVCPYDLSRPGGVQRHVLDLATAASEAGHSMTVLAPPAQAPIAATAFEILHIGRSRNWKLHGTGFEATLATSAELDALEERHRKAPFDVLHAHTLWTPFMAWQVFRRLAGQVGRRVATFHDTPPPTFSGAIMRRAFRLLSRRLSQQLDAMIAVSASPEGHLRRRAGCALYRLPPCVDLAPYLALPTPAMERAAVVLFIGRLEPRKGILTLIEALAALRRERAQVRLVVCGDGPQRDEAQARVDALNLRDAVQFLGALDERGKRRLYREADVFCAPAAYGESYGLVLAEAMAAGLPVVAAGNAGYRSVLVGEGACGLVRPNDPEELAQRLSQFLADSSLRQRLSHWGRSEALRSDVRTRLPEFLQVYAG